LPPRDTNQSDKKAEKHARDVPTGRNLRLSRGRDDDPDPAAKSERKSKGVRRSVPRRDQESGVAS
jgi:hypothetical protein